MLEGKQANKSWEYCILIKIDFVLVRGQSGRNSQNDVGFRCNLQEQAANQAETRNCCNYVSNSNFSVHTRLAAAPTTYIFNVPSSWLPRPAQRPAAVYNV